MKILSKKTPINRAIKVLLLLIITFFAALMLHIALPYLLPPFPTNIEFLATKQDVFHIKPWRWAFYVHISTSVLVIFAGLTQFSNTILKKRAELHRNIGKLYVFVILFISGPSGFFMALYANGGILGQIAFTILSVLWILFTYLAYSYARKGDLLEHGKWMFRSFALSLSAVTLRVLIFSAAFLPYEVDFEQFYRLTAWLSWGLNLAIIEILIKKGIVKRYFGRID